jgi:CubicO group peptidase (beta-lactamase class C family)
METGLPHGEYLRRELFTGGVGELWSPGQASAAKPRIGTHWSQGATGLPVNYSLAVFGPSLFTSRLETYMSARELVAFARRMFEGDLLSAQARESLLTIVQDDGRVPGQTGGGIGIRRFSYGSRVMYGNSGATTNSSAMYLYDPGTGVIVSMNTNQAGALHRNSHFNVVPALILEANKFVEAKRQGS